jgi:hypothetical protein
MGQRAQLQSRVRLQIHNRFEFGGEARCRPLPAAAPTGARRWPSGVCDQKSFRSKSLRMLTPNVLIPNYLNVSVGMKAPSQFPKKS